MPVEEVRPLTSFTLDLTSETYLKMFSYTGWFGNTQFEDSMSNLKPSRRPVGVVAASTVVFIEAAVLLFLGGLLVVDTMLGSAKSVPTAVALAALVLAPGIWLVFVVRALLRCRRWARNASLFWQLVQLSIASASFTGRFANPLIGSALVVTAVIVIALLFTKPVMRATLEANEG
jgi:hypothetical protein